jgi:hypothetical protein
MTKEDLRAVYAFIRQFGPAGKPAPDYVPYVPPGQEPAGPYVLFPVPPEQAEAD